MNELTEVRPIQDAIALAKGIVDLDDVNALNNSLPTVAEALRRDVIFRTEQQMRVSVLNDTRHPTASDKLVQANREIIVHATELFELACDYHLALIDLEEAEEELPTLHGYSRKRKEIEIARYKFRLSQMSRVAHHRIREVNTWSKIIDELEDQPVTDESVSMAVRFCREVKAMEDGNAHFPPADARNIYGLLNHSIKDVQEKGLLMEFLQTLGGDPSMIDWCIRKGILVKTEERGDYGDD